MPRLAALAALAVIFASAALSVALAMSLPDVAATHFGADGHPDGSMSRWGFGVLSLALCSGLPLALLYGLATLRAPAQPFIPVRGVYRPPASRAAHVVGPWQCAAIASGIALFMDFVFWRVWIANRSPAPTLSAGELGMGVGVFVAFLAAWSVSVVASKGRG